MKILLKKYQNYISSKRVEASKQVQLLAQNKKALKVPHKSSIRLRWKDK